MFYKFIFFGFLLLTILSHSHVIAAESKSYTANTKEIMQAAHTLQQKGLHTQALSLLLASKKTIDASTPNFDAVYIKLLNQLGDLHLQLHHWEQAAMLLSEAVILARGYEKPSLLAASLNNFANLAAIAGEDAYAQAAFNESIEISQYLKGEHPLLLQAMMNQTRLSWQQGRVTESQQQVQEILALLQSDLIFSAKQLLALSRLLHQIRLEGTKDQALFLAEYAVLERALALAKDKENAATRSQSYGYLAALYEEDHNANAALDLNQKAIFFAQQANSDELLYVWQWQKARVLLQQHQLDAAVSAYHEAIITLSPIRSALLKGQRKVQSPFRTHIRPVYMELSDALLQQANKTTDPVAQQHLLRQARDSIEAMKSLEIQDYLESDCIDLSNSQQALLDTVDAQTAIIYPIVLKNRLVILLGIADHLSQWSLSVPQTQLDATVTLLREHLQTRSNNLFLHESQQLYRWLIQPLAETLLQHKIKTLVFVPDGRLRMVPMTSLHDGQHFLIENYAIATTPGLSLTNPQPIDKQHIQVLVLGLSDAVQNFSALPSIAKEVHAVRAMFDADLLENKQFSEKNLQAMLEKKEYNVLHLATHGVFSGEPETSYLLTYDKKINMNRLQTLISLGKYNRQPLELLTLSACQTAMGNERAAMGLAGIAIQAGARSALASLWFVDDEATSQLIRLFYRNLKKEGVSKAQALQIAQRSLIQQPRFWHPAYWGAFILIGNWL